MTVPIDWSELDRQLRSPEDWIAASERGELSSGPFTGSPPAGLLRAVAHGSWAGADRLLDVARMWSQPEMSRAALDALVSEPDPSAQERLAWLLKRVLHAVHGREATSLARDPRYPAATRSWLVEGLEQLAREGSLSSVELEPVVEALERSDDPALRVRVPSLVGALPWTDRSAARLEALLDDADQEVVTSAAHTLSLHPESISKLDPLRLERVRAHPSPMVRAEAARLVPK